MTLIEMFADSIHLAELKENVARSAGDHDVGAVLVETQCCINAFVAHFGQHLVSNIVADTYMMVGEAFSSDSVKRFCVGLALYNRNTDTQKWYTFPFKLVSKEPSEHSDGKELQEVALYLDLP